LVSQALTVSALSKTSKRLGKHAMSLNAQENLKKVPEILAIPADARKKLVQLRNKRALQSFFTTNKNKCFVKHCGPQCLQCKKDATCWSAWLYDYPPQGVKRAASFDFKIAKGFSVMSNCWNAHWGTINNNCVTTNVHHPSIPVVHPSAPHLVPVLPNGGHFCLLKNTKVANDWNQIQCNARASVALGACETQFMCNWAGWTIFNQAGNRVGNQAGYYFCDSNGNVTYLTAAVNHPTGDYWWSRYNDKISLAHPA